MAVRKNFSNKTRFEIFKRDGFKCQYCGRSAPGIVLHVDHVVPITKGGDNSNSNLITSCVNCNLGKGGQPLYDDLEILEANSTKRMVWVFPEEIHRLIKAEAARLGITANDYAVKVFTETLKAE